MKLKCDDVPGKIWRAQMDVTRELIQTIDGPVLTIIVKQCTWCLDIKPITAFYTKPSHKPNTLDDHRPHCKKCHDVDVESRRLSQKQAKSAVGVLEFCET